MLITFLPIYKQPYMANFFSYADSAIFGYNYNNKNNLRATEHTKQHNIVSNEQLAFASYK